LIAYEVQKNYNGSIKGSLKILPLISRTCAQIAMQMADGQTSHAVVLLDVRVSGWK